MGRRGEESGKESGKERRVERRVGGQWKGRTGWRGNESAAEYQKGEGRRGKGEM